MAVNFDHALAGRAAGAAELRTVAREEVLLHVSLLCTIQHIHVCRWGHTLESRISSLGGGESWHRRVVGFAN